MLINEEWQVQTIKALVLSWIHLATQDARMERDSKHIQKERLSQNTVVLCIGMNEVLAHYACTFENSDLHFHFQ